LEHVWGIKSITFHSILLFGIFVSVSFLITGEGLLLFAGLLIFRRLSHEWANVINLIFLTSDLLLGGFFLFESLSKGLIHNNLWFQVALIALIASHSIRLGQNLLKSKNPFCFNPPLEIVNFLKLAGFLILFIFSFL
jgi:hypothetical protein